MSPTAEKIGNERASDLPADGQAPLLGESSVDYRDPGKGPAVKAMFSGIARRYDLLNHLLSLNLDRHWRRATVRLAAAQSGERVLDVCCGTGDLAFAFRRAVGSAGYVAATDFTPAMTTIGKKKAARGAGSVEFSVADTLSLPFPDASFDICGVGFGIRNVADVAAGIREMARVVRPGGRVAILEFTQPKGKLFSRFFRFYMTRVLPRIGQWLSRSKEKAYSYLPDSIALFPGPDKLASMMETCGLSEVRWTTRTFGIVAIHVGTRR